MSDSSQSSSLPSAAGAAASRVVNQLIQTGQDTRKIHDHKVDSINLLIFTFLLILVILTIWLFKYKRFPYIHETGLAIFYGAIFGIIIRYGFTPINKRSISLNTDTNYTISDINDVPEYIHLKLFNYSETINYKYVGPSKGGSELQQDYEEKAQFDPEIFFNILLPPIIFHAGYSMKRRHFFKNFGAILTFAFFGTTISSFFIGGFMYMIILIFRSIRTYFSFTDCLYFGALISSTDPVTVLAIFNDQKVDVNLYALVFGESVLNDAVSITLAQAIEQYSAVNSDQFDVKNFFKCIGNFIIVFSGSFGIGSVMGCITALIHIRQHPHLETALFTLMSYSTFLASEAAGLTGIVAVLFCGIVQAHYTYNNLSKQSQEQTREIFHLLNFLSENFIFVYIGISMFTFRSHQWEASFILFSFVAIIIARALNIYPLAFLINLTRTNKIKYNMQHMMMFSGLRGAMAFALAMRNTSTKARQLILTTTSIIVIFTVIVCGGLTSKMLVWLRIRTGNDSEIDSKFQVSNTDSNDNQSSKTVNVKRFKGCLSRNCVLNAWHDFDKDYMKPFFTHARPTLIETVPKCCLPLARLLTTREQFGIVSLNGSQSSLLNDDPLLQADEPSYQQKIQQYSQLKQIDDNEQKQEQQKRSNDNNNNDNNTSDKNIIQMDSILM